MVTLNKSWKYYLSVSTVVLIIFLSLPYMCRSQHHDHGHSHDDNPSFKYSRQANEGSHSHEHHEGAHSHEHHKVKHSHEHHKSDNFEKEKHIRTDEGIKL